MAMMLNGHNRLLQQAPQSCLLGRHSMVNHPDRNGAWMRLPAVFIATLQSIKRGNGKKGGSTVQATKER